MTKQIEDYTADELSAKIEAIKAERERTANALKKYEEELERRKKEIPLGVPLSSLIGSKACNKYLYLFSSKESGKVFDERLAKWVESLQKLAKGEPIDIKVLLPLLKKGWVAMDKNGDWCWYKEKPYIEKYYYSWNSGMPVSSMRGFNLKPATDWKDSLMECGL